MHARWWSGNRTFTISPLLFHPQKKKEVLNQFSLLFILFKSKDDSKNTHWRKSISRNLFSFEEEWWEMQMRVTHIYSSHPLLKGGEMSKRCKRARLNNNCSSSGTFAFHIPLSWKLNHLPRDFFLLQAQLNGRHYLTKPTTPKPLLLPNLR